MHFNIRHEVGFGCFLQFSSLRAGSKLVFRQHHLVLSKVTSDFLIASLNFEDREPVS
jgi:hypothetical protein